MSSATPSHTESTFTNRALFLATLSPLVSGVATVFLSKAVRELPPVTVAALGCLLGGAAILVIAILLRQISGISRIPEHLKLFIWVTLLRSVAGAALFVVGARHTDAVKVVFFTKIEPYFVLFWAWILAQEKVTRSELVLLTVHILGAILLSTSGNLISFGEAQFGDLCIIGSTFLSGYSYHHARKLSLSTGSLVASGATSFVGGALLLSAAIWIEPWPTGNHSVAWQCFGMHLLLFYVISLTSWYAALPHLRGWIVSALRALGPISGVPMAYWLLDEKLDVVQIGGGILVLLTSALIGRFQAKR